MAFPHRARTRSPQFPSAAAFFVTDDEVFGGEAVTDSVLRNAGFAFFGLDAVEVCAQALAVNNAKARAVGRHRFLIAFMEIQSSPFEVLLRPFALPMGDKGWTYGHQSKTGLS